MEVKHESDLTGKEKRSLEIQKIRNMSWGKRLPYLWTYYKYWLLGLIIVGVFLWFGITVYRNAQKTELLSIVVMDARMENDEGEEQLQSDLLKAIGTGNKNEIIAMDTTVSSGDDYASVIKRTTALETGTSDVLVCGESAYDQYEEKELFLDWKEVLGSDYEKYEAYIVDGKLDLSSSQVWEKYGLTAYEPVYMGALAGTDNRENIKKMAEYFY